MLALFVVVELEIEQEVGDRVIAHLTGFGGRQVFRRSSGSFCGGSGGFGDRLGACFDGDRLFFGCGFGSVVEVDLELVRCRALLHRRSGDGGVARLWS